MHANKLLHMRLTDNHLIRVHFEILDLLLQLALLGFARLEQLLELVDLLERARLNRRVGAHIAIQMTVRIARSMQHSVVVGLRTRIAP